MHECSRYLSGNCLQYIDIDKRSLSREGRDPVSAFSDDQKAE